MMAPTTPATAAARAARPAATPAPEIHSTRLAGVLDLRGACRCPLEISALPISDGRTIGAFEITIRPLSAAQHRIGESIDSLLARTERTMYLAKQFGRDRVEVSPTPPSRVERAKVVGIRD